MNYRAMSVDTFYQTIQTYGVPPSLQEREDTAPLYFVGSLSQQEFQLPLTYSELETLDRRIPNEN